MGFNKLYLCLEPFAEAYAAALAAVPALTALLAKHSDFQGRRVPVYHALLVPEQTGRQRLVDYLRFHDTDRYLSLRALLGR
jgi:hypothetical protein